MFTVQGLITHVPTWKRIRASLLFKGSHCLGLTGEGVDICLQLGGSRVHTAWKASSRNGVKLSSAPDSATQSDDTPSRHLPLSSQRATPDALTIIRAKRVSNCYIPKKKFVQRACVVCSTNLGFSVGYACVRLILVLVWGTYYVPDTYVLGISR